MGWCRPPCPDNPSDPFAPPPGPSFSCPERRKMKDEAHVVVIVVVVIVVVVVVVVVLFVVAVVFVVFVVVVCF